MKRVVLFTLLGLVLVCIGFVVGGLFGYSLGWTGFQIRTQNVGHEEVALATLSTYKGEVGGTATAQLFETLAVGATQGAVSTPTPTQTQETTLPVVVEATELLPTQTPGPSDVPPPTFTLIPTVTLEPVVWFCEDDAFDSLEAALEDKFPDAVGRHVCAELLEIKDSAPKVVYVDHIESQGMVVVGPQIVEQLLKKYPFSKYIVVSGLDVADQYKDFGSSVIVVQNQKRGNWTKVLDAIENALN